MKDYYQILGLQKGASRDEVKKALKAGSFSIWKGPMLNATGEKVLNAGQVADDKFLSGIKFYVAGVSDLSEAKK